MRGMTKLEEFQFELGMNGEYMPNEFVADVFHYTSPAGFTSILLNNLSHVTVWASRFDCLNDFSEGIYVKSVFNEVCEELRDSKIITEKMFDQFIKADVKRTKCLIYFEGEHYNTIWREYDRYIFSLSKNKDSLAMWNYYSKGSKYEGFNIGFDLTSMEESLREIFCGKEVQYESYPIVYLKQEQKRIIREFLEKLAEMYSEEEKDSICDTISDQLTDWSLVFKSEYFQHEEEVRFIFDVSKDEKNVPIKYRVNSGYLIPYIELRLNKEDVISAYFGPLQCTDEQKKKQVEVMEEMLQRNGYSADADYSKVPVRY